MTPVEEQKNIIEKLHWLVKISLEMPYDSACLWLDYQQFDDGSSSIGGRLSYTWEGEKKYAVVRSPEDEILDDVIPHLHALMKAHTGGSWTFFTLTIDKDGKVTTKFNYPDAEGIPADT